MLLNICYDSGFQLVRVNARLWRRLVRLKDGECIFISFCSYTPCFLYASYVLFLFFVLILPSTSNSSHLFDYRPPFFSVSVLVPLEESRHRHCPLYRLWHHRGYNNSILSSSRPSSAAIISNNPPSQHLTDDTKLNCDLAVYLTLDMVFFVKLCCRSTAHQDQGKSGLDNERRRWASCRSVFRRIYQLLQYQHPQLLTAKDEPAFTCFSHRLRCVFVFLS